MAASLGDWLDSAYPTTITKSAKLDSCAATREGDQLVCAPSFDASSLPSSPTAQLQSPLQKYRYPGLEFVGKVMARLAHGIRAKNGND